LRIILAAGGNSPSFSLVKGAFMPDPAASSRIDAQAGVALLVRGLRRSGRCRRRRRRGWAGSSRDGAREPMYQQDRRRVRTSTRHPRAAPAEPIIRRRPWPPASCRCGPVLSERGDILRGAGAGASEVSVLATRRRLIVEQKWAQWRAHVRPGMGCIDRSLELLAPLRGQTPRDALNWNDR